MYIGIDDTDSRSGMCTTYLVVVLLREFQDIADIIGFPRLVRLNPNVPWKTRGNGAVTLRFGIGAGSRIQIGHIEGEPVYAYSKLKKTVCIDVEDIVKAVERYFQLKDPNTNPGIVLSHKKPVERIYWMAVRDIVNIEDIRDELKRINARHKCFKDCRGLIGATASIAWRPRKYTYELLAYLPESEWSSERTISKSSVLKINEKFKTLFDTYDNMNDYAAIMPRSKTPVLYGLRGTDVDDLRRAMKLVDSIPQPSSYLIFKTNQATDDHIVKKKISSVKAYESVRIKGTVISKPKVIEGGHVIFSISDGSGMIECAAYEPTKQFRNIIKAIIPGDVVEVFGGIRGEPLTVNIEKIRIIKLEEMRVKIKNPACPICGKSMESIGKNKGYRCRKCGTRASEKDAEYRTLPREIHEGWYEVPVCARRHLSRPLKLIADI